MKALTETYRPSRLSDIRGQPAAVKALQGKLRMQSSFACILHGEPGCGKTSAAYAIGAELGADVNGSEAQRISTGFWIVPSGSQSIERIREVFEHCRYRPLCGSMFWVVVFNEADCQSAQARKFWLDQLELLPTKTIVVFTTNEFDQFPEAMRQRCLCLKFESDAGRLWTEATALVSGVWLKETGHNHAPSLEELGFVRTGSLSFRSVLGALEPLVFAEVPSDSGEAKPPAMQPEPVCIIESQPVTKDKTFRTLKELLAEVRT